MSKGKISQKQIMILEFIRDNILNKGYPPTVRDICEAVNLSSTATVHAHLAALEDKGYIRRDPSKPRAIEIIDDDFALPYREFVNIPVVGDIAAGEPILAEQNIRDYFPLPADLLPNDKVFMLTVRGDSMTGAGILDGDQILARQKNTAQNGDIVVALTQDGATVKRFYKEEGFIRLQPENDDYEPILLRNVELLGEVIGVFRFL